MRTVFLQDRQGPRCSLFIDVFAPSQYNLRRPGEGWGAYIPGFPDLGCWALPHAMVGEANARSDKDERICDYRKWR